MLTIFTMTQPTDLAPVVAWLIRRLMPGDRVGLIGSLGAGKTTLIQAVAEAYGITGPVESPTFTLRQEYPVPSRGQLAALIHYDLYRLPPAKPRALAELGLADDWCRADAVLLIEWADRLGTFKTELTHLIAIDIDYPTNQRQLTVTWEKNDERPHY